MTQDQPDYIGHRQRLRARFLAGGGKDMPDSHRLIYFTYRKLFCQEKLWDFLNFFLRFFDIGAGLCYTVPEMNIIPISEVTYY